MSFFCIGKPDPPEDFQAQNVTSDRVLLSWSAGFDGGSPQFFRIRYMVKGSEEINTVDVLPTNASVFMITGLEPGTEYSFALMAWNVYGESGYTENEVVAQTTGEFAYLFLLLNYFDDFKFRNLFSDFPAFQIHE
ncbi:nephrin [Trichonephila clavipes]|nr:nephrin [Trichonephila clavipes]